MNEEKEIRFIDLFAGIGGFRLGLERANKDIYGVEEGQVPRGDGGYSSNTSVENGRGWKQRAVYNSTFRCVWSNDINKYANQVYTKNFGETNHYSGDIRGVDPRDIPPHDLLCGGFPCQSFSVAGKRKGFTDTRGTLFFEILRIAKHHRPRLLLLENVKGLLSAPLVDETGDTIPGTHGRVFETILKSLEDLGYWWEYQVLNSKDYGVPQNRERVFIIGHLRGKSGRPIFPITETDGVANQNGRGRSPVQAEIGSAIHSRYGAGWRAHGQEQLISTAIDANYYKGVDRHGQRTVVLDTFNRGGTKEEEADSLKTNPSPTSSAVVALRQIGTLGKDNQASRVYSANGLSPTIPTPGGGHHMPKIVMPVLTPDRAEKRQHGRRFKEDGDPMFTLTGQDIHGVMIQNAVEPIEYRRIRRLTPCECERLQGFPDGWTEWGIEKGEKVKISDTQRYKMLGNAVTVPVITFLGQRIQEALK